MSMRIRSQKSITRRRDEDSRLIEYANRNRNEEFFTDVKIEIQSQTISANRLVLSCYSRYFEEKLKNQIEPNSSIKIEDIDAKATRVLINFIYTGQVFIDQDNVINLLHAARTLMIDEVQEYCCDFLQSIVDADNCLYILHAIAPHQQETLKSKIYDIMIENVETVIKSVEFQKLCKDDLISFLSLNRDKIDQKLIYEALRTWTKYEEQTRLDALSDLLRLLKIDQLPTDYTLNPPSHESLLRKNLSCSKLTLEKIDQLLLETESKFLNKLSLINLGGNKTLQKVKEVLNVEKLDNKKQNMYSDLPVKLYNHCSLTLDAFVFCIGGNSEDFLPTKDVFQLNLHKKSLQWEAVAYMNKERSMFGAAVFEDSLVVAGGYDGNTPLKSTEQYSSTCSHWTTIAQLKQPRYGNALVACERCLLAIGGFNAKYLSSVEQLSGLEAAWKSVSPMQVPRMHLAAVCLQNEIYAMGGQSGRSDSTILKSVEKFNFDTNRWEFVSEMNFERSGHTACVMQGKIFVVGGKDRNGEIVKEIERCDTSCNTWSVISKTADKWVNHSSVAI